MTTVRDFPAAVQVGNYLYVLGGGNPFWVNCLTSVERAAINSDGSLGTWQIISSLSTARAAHAAVAVGGYVYALGGYTSGGGSWSSVEFAAIINDGSLGTWQPTTAMTLERHGLAAVAINGYVYALGGRDSYSVERAAINPDGSLGVWQTMTSMNTRRSYLGSMQK
jgi:hypothetical protein